MPKTPRITGKTSGSTSTMRGLLPDFSGRSPIERGFTLIEVLIVVVVVAILAAIAVPSYQSFVLKSHRADAKTALATLQMAQEKYRGNNLTYASTLTALGLTTTSPQGYYTLNIPSSAASASGYEATATATGQQSADTTCQKLTVTQAGFSTDSAKTSNPSECWGL